MDLVVYGARQFGIKTLSLATDSGYVFFFIILYIKNSYLDLEKILSSG